MVHQVVDQELVLVQVVAQVQAEALAVVEHLLVQVLHLLMLDVYQVFQFIQVVLLEVELAKQATTEHQWVVLA
jgi:hypothetical protein